MKLFVRKVVPFWVKWLKFMSGVTASTMDVERLKVNRVLRWMRYIMKHLTMLTVHDHRLHLSCAWFWSSDGKSFHQAVKGDWCLLIDVATLTLDRTQDDTRHFDIFFNSFAMTSEVTVESKQSAGCGFRMDAAWISRSPGRFRSWTSLTA